MSIAITLEELFGEEPELITQDVPVPELGEGKVWTVRTMSYSEQITLAAKTRKESGSINETALEQWKLIYGTRSPMLSGMKWDDSRGKLTIANPTLAVADAKKLLDSPSHALVMRRVMSVIEDLNPDPSAPLDIIATNLLGNRVLFALCMAAQRSGKLYDLLTVTDPAEQEKLTSALIPIMGYFQAEGMLSQLGIDPAQWAMTDSGRETVKAAREGIEAT